MKTKFKCETVFEWGELSFLDSRLLHDIAAKMSKFLLNHGYGNTYCHLYYPSNNDSINRQKYGYVLDITSDGSIDVSIVNEIISKIKEWQDEVIDDNEKEALRLKKLVQTFLKNLKVPPKKEISYNSSTYHNDQETDEYYEKTIQDIDRCKYCLKEKDYRSANYVTERIKFRFKIYSFMLVNDFKELAKLYDSVRSSGMCYEFPDFIKKKIISYKELYG